MSTPTPHPTPPAPPVPPVPRLIVGLIVVGDEILSGKRRDGHVPHLIELLAARGLHLDWAEYVGDRRERLTATLQRAFASSDVVFSTGGIGATPDDHTRQCAAAALGVGLALHPEAKTLIEARTREQARQLGLSADPERPENRQRLQMGVFPLGARIIPNPYNQIPGFSCDGPGGGRIHFLPGFPVMAWPMMEWVLDQHYARYFARGQWLEMSVVLPGAIESALTPLMVQIERDFAGVTVFSLPSVDHPQWGRCIELGVKGTPAQVKTAYTALRTILVQEDRHLGTESVRTF